MIGGYLRTAAVISGSVAVGAVFAAVMLHGNDGPPGPGQVIVAGLIGASAAEAIDRDISDDWRS